MTRCAVEPSVTKRPLRSDRSAPQLRHLPTLGKEQKTMIIRLNFKSSRKYQGLEFSMVMKFMRKTKGKKKTPELSFLHPVLTTKISNMHTCTHTHLGHSPCKWVLELEFSFRGTQKFQVNTPHDTNMYKKGWDFISKLAYIEGTGANKWLWHTRNRNRVGRV